MHNLNSVVLEGELMKTPDYQTDKNGNQICRFALASSRYFKNANGIEKETGYFDIEARGTLAAQCRQYGCQGRGARVVGRLKQEHFRNKAGEPLARIVIVAEDVEFRPAMNPEQRQPIHHDDDYDRGR
jgi:single-strand DNA-binding protein